MQEGSQGPLANSWQNESNGEREQIGRKCTEVNSMKVGALKENTL